MALRLSAEADWAIRAHAYTTYPEECCGLLLGQDGDPRLVAAARPMPNVREGDRTRRYLIDPLDLMRAEEEAEAAGQAVLGFYHTHPDHPSKPSEFDRAHAWPWYSYVILAVARGQPGELTSWRLRDDRSAFEAEPLASP